MSKINILTFIILNYSSFTFGQKPCDCDINRITSFNKSESGTGAATSYFDNEMLQHPITTFDKTANNTYFKKNVKWFENRKNLKEWFKDRYVNNAEVRDLYKSLYNVYISYLNSYSGAKKSLRTEYDANSYNSDANVAKACAFIAMVNLDANGDTLTTSLSREFADTAKSILLRLEFAEFNKMHTGFSLSYSSKHYHISKNIIAYLQAYDYLKAIDRNDEETERCGYLLQCYTSYFYTYAKQVIGAGAIYRNDNHSLM